MEKKPVTLGVVILFGVVAVVWIVYAVWELLYGVPDFLRFLRLAACVLWIFAFVGALIKYLKQKKG